MLKADLNVFYSLSVDCIDFTVFYWSEFTEQFGHTFETNCNMALKEFLPLVVCQQLVTVANKHIFRR